MDPIPTFRGGVDCPIPREWILTAALVGFVIGWLARRAR